MTLNHWGSVVKEGEHWTQCRLIALHLGIHNSMVSTMGPHPSTTTTPQPTSPWVSGERGSKQYADTPHLPVCWGHPQLLPSVKNKMDIPVVGVIATQKKRFRVRTPMPTIYLYWHP